MANPTPLTPEAIKAARLRLGLSQEQLAHRIGASHSTVNRWEATGDTARTPRGLYADAVRRLIAEADATPNRD